MNSGAATIEFIYDLQSKKHYFLEMNTRIQIEYGVTEAVTHVDIVKEQLLAASEEGLDIKQESIKIHGCAINARINAESPPNNLHHPWD
ncbi:MAG: hypothetical protein ABF820_10580 [Sporolactobacillus sp.]